MEKGGKARTDSGQWDGALTKRFRVCVLPSRYSAHAASAAKRRNGKRHHHQCKPDGKRHQPSRSVFLPFAPGASGAHHSEQHKERASGFMKHLPRDAPQRAKQAAAGAKQRLLQEQVHAEILVQSRTPHEPQRQVGRLGTRPA